MLKILEFQDKLRLSHGDIIYETKAREQFENLIGYDDLIIGVSMSKQYNVTDRGTITIETITVFYKEE